MIKIVSKTIKDNFYPLEDCLKVCVEYKQLEACALLHKKIGAYKESILMYLSILDKELVMKDFRKALFIYDKREQKK